MRTNRLTAALVLAVASAALVASVAWAVARSDEGDWMMMRYGPGLMGYAPTGAGEPIESLDEAGRRADAFADRLGLQVGEVMEFTNHYYGELLETDGRAASEILLNPSTGAAWLEYGPAMMWNTRYGMMNQAGMGSAGTMMGGMMGATMMGSGGMGGDMMGGSFADPTWMPTDDPSRGETISAAEAERIAEQWLERTDSSMSIGEAEAFPGYFTLHTLQDGNVSGMLSVNAYTGAVWYHWWHGHFVAMSE